MSGVVTVTTIVVGFLTLWARLRYNATEVKTEVAARAEEVGSKIDDNTKKTEAVDSKAAVIVRQTNGALDVLRESVKQAVDRVAKLEEYNRTSAHRTLDAINAVHLKVTELAAVVQAMKAKPPEVRLYAPDPDPGDTTPPRGA